MKRDKSAVTSRNAAAHPTHHPQWIRSALALGNRFHSRRQDPWRHNAINLTALAVVLCGVVGLCALSRALDPLLFLPIGALAFG